MLNKLCSSDKNHMKILYNRGNKLQPTEVDFVEQPTYGSMTYNSPMTYVHHWSPKHTYFCDTHMNWLHIVSIKMKIHKLLSTQAQRPEFTHESYTMYHEESAILWENIA
jgi:hypothetical protein